MRTFVFVVTLAAVGSPGFCQGQGQTGPVISTNIFEALRQGEMAKVKAAINNGADVNTRDANGATLLMQAALYASAADLELLLAHGADVNAANKAGHTALMRAMPDLVKIKVLVEHGADVNAAAGGTTPLLIASGLPSAAEVVRYLIQKGSDIKAVSGFGVDAVMTAAAEGQAGTLKILLDAGASGASEAKNRVLPATARTAKLDQAALERIKKLTEGVTALMSAARVDCEACIRLLLQNGADAKAKTYGGLTALHYAAYKGNLAMTKLFLDAGAEVNVADGRGFTPLMMAANSKNKNPEVVRLLLDRGAGIEAKDERGRTAADWSRIGARREIVRMFPDSGAVEAVKTSVEPAFKDVHSAVKKSITLLEEAAPKFFPKSGCISCHNVSIPLMALTEARGRGYPVKAESRQQLVKQTVAAFGPQRDNLLSGFCGIAGSAPTGPYT